MKVVNKKDKNYISDFVRDLHIGRGSILGNPFTEKEFGREECIRLYKIHFDYMIKHSSQFREALFIASNHDRLVCYCKPKACHGDIIKEHIEKTLSWKNETRIK